LLPIERTTQRFIPRQQQQQQLQHHTTTTTTTTSTRLHATTAADADAAADAVSTSDDASNTNTDNNIDNDFAIQNGKFDINTALFCAGLAFDSYVEPPPDSSRWERGVSIYILYSIY
jgi:hypothetical protein